MVVDRNGIDKNVVDLEMVWFVNHGLLSTFVNKDVTVRKKNEIE